MRIHFIVKNLAVLSCIGGLAYSENLMAQQPAQPKPATEATKAANLALQQYLNFNDRGRFR